MPCQDDHSSKDLVLFLHWKASYMYGNWVERVIPIRSDGSVDKYALPRVMSSILRTRVVKGEQTLTSYPMTGIFTPWLLHALGEKKNPIYTNSLPSHRLRVLAPPTTEECWLCFQEHGLTTHRPPHKGLPELASLQITLAIFQTAGLFCPLQPTVDTKRLIAPEMQDDLEGLLKPVFV